MNDLKKTRTWFAITVCFFWASSCSYFSYLVFFLANNNYTSLQIGLAMTVVSIVSIVFILTEGYLADFVIPIKKLIKYSLILAIPVAFLLKLTVGVYPLAVVSIALMAFCIKPAGCLIDSWGMKLSQKYEKLNYSLLRSLASATFAFSALGLGKFFDVFGVSWMFIFFAFFAILSLVGVFNLEGVPIAEKNAEKTDSYFTVLKKLLKNKRYLVLIISISLAGISLVSVNSFMPVYLKQLGGTNSSLGLIFFVMAIGEVPVMATFSKVSSKFKAESLLTIAFAFIILRVFAIYLVNDLPGLISVQIIQAISYGLYLPSLLLYICRITPQSTHASAITLAIALSDGVSGIVGNMIAGVISDIWGVKTVFLSFTFIAISAFLMFVIGTNLQKRL